MELDHVIPCNAFNNEMYEYSADDTQIHLFVVW